MAILPTDPNERPRQRGTWDTSPRDIPDEIRRALGYLGSIKTARKAESSRQNGKLYGGRPQTPLSDLPCSCGGTDPDHKATCPRGRAIRRRSAG